MARPGNLAAQPSQSGLCFKEGRSLWGRFPWNPQVQAQYALTANPNSNRPTILDENRV